MYKMCFAKISLDFLIAKRLLQKKERNQKWMERIRYQHYLCEKRESNKKY